MGVPELTRAMQVKILLVLYISISGINVSSAHPDHIDACPEMAPCHCLSAYQPDLNKTQEDPWLEANILNCDNVGLRSMPDLTPIATHGIQRVWFPYNEIGNIKANDFMKYKFEEVQLQSNHIEKIHPKAFQHMATTIRYLDVSGSRHIEISRDGLQFLSGMVNLRYLNVGWNNLKDGILKRGIFDKMDLNHLNELTLGGLHMKAIEKGALASLKTLEILNIGTNDFLTVPVEVTKLSNLKTLSLSSTEGLKLSKTSFTGLSKLEKLSLSYMSLKKVPGQAIAELHNLKELELSYNKISKIHPDDFSGNYSLEALSIGGNPVQFRKGMFGRLVKSLKELDLMQANISRLPVEVLEELTKLEEIDLSYGNFESIDDDFFGNLSLSDVSLEYNENLNSISPMAMVRMKKPLRLDLRSTALTDISFLHDAPPCTFVFNILDINFNKIPCDCMLERIIHSGQVGGIFTGTCYYSNDSSWYFSVVNSNLTSIPPGLGSHLIAQCGQSKKQYICQETNASQQNCVIDLLLLTFLGLILIIS